MKFKALRVSETVDKAGKATFKQSIETLDLNDLPAGDVLIKVAFSSLNYKDALSATGNRGVTRQFPHTPGIDAAGAVIASSADGIYAGDQVIVTGYDLGMNTAGGFGQYIRVPAAWCVPIPKGMTAKDAMVFGTAGITAALSVIKLEQRGVRPEEGPLLVTGATGGVGTVAMALLTKLGYQVVAMSGKPDAASYCQRFGVGKVLDRSEFLTSKKPMLSARWRGAVDCVGGEVLGTVLKQMTPAGVVTACGLAGGTEFCASVFPFIIRGVELLGIDSVEIPLNQKAAVWMKLANEWRIDWPADTVKEISLLQVPDHIQSMLKAAHYGRVVIKHEC